MGKVENGYLKFSNLLLKKTSVFTQFSGRVHKIYIFLSFLCLFFELLQIKFPCFSYGHHLFILKHKSFQLNLPLTNIMICTEKSKKSCIVTSHDVSLNNDVYRVQFLSACRWNLPSYIDESGSVLTLDQCQFSHR